MSTGIRGEALRFLLAGALNTAATYAVYLVLLRVADYTLAYTMAYVAGIVLAYALNTAFVFRVRRSLRGFAAFPLVYVAQYVAGALVLNLAVRVLGVRQELALLASIAVTVPLTFVLSRFVLKPRIAPSGGPHG
ncbi:MAG TPA: GtrA family protein [Rudaea sp.]|nr:GtrA family protein [Rudaea sp.]